MRAGFAVGRPSTVFASDGTGAGPAGLDGLGLDGVGFGGTGLDEAGRCGIGVEPEIGASGRRSHGADA